MVKKKYLSLFPILLGLVFVADASQAFQHSSKVESQEMMALKGLRTNNDDAVDSLKPPFTQEQGMTKENIAEEDSPALAKIVAELKNEVNQLNGRVTRLEIMKPVDESFENRRVRRGSSNEANATKSKSAPKPCLVREACAYDFKISSNSTVITPSNGQPTGTSELDAKTSSLPEVVQSNSYNMSNIDSNSSPDRLIFHLQIKSNKIVQQLGEPIVFDNIILNAENSYDPDKTAFFVPFTGSYRFEFEAKVLEKKNVTFRYAGRVSPDYKAGWTLKDAAPSDLKNNVVKMVTAFQLNKATRIQVKSVGKPADGEYTLSANYPTSFKGYLLP